MFGNGSATGMYVTSYDFFKFCHSQLGQKPHLLPTEFSNVQCIVPVQGTVYHLHRTFNLISTIKQSIWKLVQTQAYASLPSHHKLEIKLPLFIIA